MSQSLSPTAALAGETSPVPTKYGGVYPAKVYATNDPTHAGRIQMCVPQIFGTMPVQIWAPCCIAGGVVPAVGSVVWCLFQGGDPAYPVYIPPIAPPSPLSDYSSGSESVPATADVTTYASMPTPVRIAVDFGGGDWQCLFLFSAHIDITVNNAEVALALDISGANVIPAGSEPYNRIHVIAKSPISSTFSLQQYGTLLGGETDIELMHAGSACTISDVALQIVPFMMVL